MRRRIIMALLAVGAIGGFASGFHHLRACRGGEWRERAAMEQRSDCTDHHARAADGDDR